MSAVERTLPAVRNEEGKRLTYHVKRTFRFSHSF
jgi:hypothetical protein